MKCKFVIWSLTLLLFLIGNSPGAVANSENEKLANRCLGGDAVLCPAIGQRMQAEGDFLEARRLLGAGCSAGGRDSCKALFTLGKLYRDGDSTVRNPAVAVSIFEQACAGSSDGSRNYSPACPAAGQMLRDGDGGPVNPEKAFILIERGCATRSHYACALLGEAYEKGQGVSVDADQAFMYYDRACMASDEQNEACTAAGLLVLTDTTRSDNQQEALIYFERGCRYNDRMGRACHEWAMLTPEPADALEYLTLACRADKPWPPSCAAAADRYWQGEGVEADLDWARTYFDYGCRLDEPRACRSRCELACETGQQWGCEAVADNAIPVGVASCLSDPSDTIPDEMKDLMKQYFEDHPEEAEKLYQQLNEGDSGS